MGASKSFSQEKTDQGPSLGEAQRAPKGLLRLMQPHLRKKKALPTHAYCSRLSWSPVFPGLMPLIILSIMVKDSASGASLGLNVNSM